MIYQPTPLETVVSVDESYTVHYFEYYREYVFDGERHDFWEFLYIDKGEISATCNGELTLLHAGQAVLYRPNEFHALRANGVSAPNTVVVSFRANAEQLKRLTGTVLTVTSAAKPIIAEILSEAKMSFSTDLGDPCYTHLELRAEQPFGALQLIRIDIERLFIHLLRAISVSKKDAGRTATNKQNEERMLLFNAETYIENHLAESLSMEQIAAASGTSASLLNRLFNKYTGSGIIGYLRRRRIRAACEMIRASDCNFTQIAERTGFQSIHYFSRTFKQIEGMTPSEYAASVKAMSGPDKE